MWPFLKGKIPWYALKVTASGSLLAVSLGLRYDEKDEKQRTEELEYKNVYINPSA
jgi:hypothetical protein